MKLFILAPLMFLPVVTLVVGARLLLLAKRTRELPEATMGAALLVIATLGMPTTALGKAPAIAVTATGEAITSVGLFFISAGIVLIYVFTAAVFRRDSRWASWAPVLVGGCLLLALADRFSRIGEAVSLEQVLQNQRLYVLTVMGSLCLAFLWTSFEGLRYYALLRRRLALGLADPVITNRFLLWGLGAASGAVLISSVGIFVMAGVVVVRSTAALTLISSMGTFVAGSWYLAFLPPQRYLRILRGGA